MLPQAFDIGRGDAPFALKLVKYEPPVVDVPKTDPGPKHDLSCLAGSDAAGLAKKGIAVPKTSKPRVKILSFYIMTEDWEAYQKMLGVDRAREVFHASFKVRGPGSRQVNENWESSDWMRRQMGLALRTGDGSTFEANGLPTVFNAKKIVAGKPSTEKELSVDEFVSDWKAFVNKFMEKDAVDWLQAVSGNGARRWEEVYFKEMRRISNEMRRLLSLPPRN